MKKIIIYDREQQDHIPRWLSGLAEYFKNKNFGIETCHMHKIPDFQNCKLLLMWNGAEPIHQPILERARQENIRILFVECGPIAQKNYYYIDEKGINAQSSLMDDDLSWVSEEHVDKLELFRQAYLDNRKWNPPGKYIFVPLQIESDTNIIKNSPYKTMQSFINHCEEKFQDEYIIFKTHPLLPNLNYRIHGNNAIIRQGSFLDHIQEAKLVYGLTSTALLESTLMGVPTECIGDCWLNKHKGNEEKLLATLVDKQIPIGSSDLDYWIGKYVNFS